MVPKFWCFVFKHRWVVAPGVNYQDGVDVEGTCQRCNDIANWNENMGAGEPPARPRWQDVRRAMREADDAE